MEIVMTKYIVMFGLYAIFGLIVTVMSIYSWIFVFGLASFIAMICLSCGFSLVMHYWLVAQCDEIDTAETELEEIRKELALPNQE
jgi:hypothetical protein